MLLCQRRQILVLDPQGLAWEHFHTWGEIPVFGEDSSITPNGSEENCCIPLYQKKNAPNEAPTAVNASPTACCLTTGRRDSCC